MTPDEIKQRNKAKLFQQRQERKTEYDSRPKQRTERAQETPEEIEAQATDIFRKMYPTFEQKWLGNPLLIEVPKKPDGWNVSKEVVERVLEGFRYRQPELTFEQKWDREERTRLIRVSG